MASNDLIIDDRYCKTVADFCIDQSSVLEQLVSEYLRILNDVLQSGITAGSTHDVLKVYVSYAEKLRDQFNDFSETAKSQIVSFNQKIDAADQYLF